MNVKTLLLAGACAIGFGTAAFAVDQSVIDTITSGLAAQGYTSMHVYNGPNGVKVEASGPNGKIEQVYDAQGNLLKEETDTGSDDGFNGGIGDDDGLDDDMNDDMNDDMDDDHDDDSNDDDSNDDDSNDDDENDDDSNDDDSNDDDSNDDEGDDD